MPATQTQQPSTESAATAAADLPAGRSVVVKVGGSALQDPATVDALAEGLAALQDEGVRPVVVHGGGPQVSEALEAAGHESTFREGMRVTPPEALAVAEPALAAVGKRLAGALTAWGLPAMALSGRDGHLVQARQEPHLDRVGIVTSVEADPLRLLTFNGLVPVLGPPAVDGQGEPLNVNADDVASATSKALGADALVLLTDVEGVHDGDGLVDHVHPADLATLRDQAAEAGMIPKLHAAQAALEDGVGRVLVGHADTPLPALLQGKAPATTITAEAPQ